MCRQKRGGIEKTQPIATLHGHFMTPETEEAPPD
jgi:hypothetical protein